MSRFIILQGLFDNSCIVGRKRIFVFGFPGNGYSPVDNLEDVNFEKHPEKYGFIAAHKNTIVLNEALVYELAKRYPDSHVFGMKPGLVSTGIRDNVHGGSDSALGWLMEGVLHTFVSVSPETYVERAALPLAMDTDLDTETAKMFDPHGKEIPSKGWVEKEENRARAWEESAKLVARAERGEITVMDKDGDTASKTHVVDSSQDGHDTDKQAPDAGGYVQGAKKDGDAADEHKDEGDAAKAQGGQAEATTADKPASETVSDGFEAESQDAGAATVEATGKGTVSSAGEVKTEIHKPGTHQEETEAGAAKIV